MRLKYKLYRKYAVGALWDGITSQNRFSLPSRALPCFEDFGNLPTDLVCSDGLVDGKPASEVLDMLSFQAEAWLNPKASTTKLPVK